MLHNFTFPVFHVSCCCAITCSSHSVLTLSLVSCHQMKAADIKFGWFWAVFRLFVPQLFAVQPFPRFCARFPLVLTHFLSMMLASYVVLIACMSSTDLWCPFPSLRIGSSILLDFARCNPVCWLCFHSFQPFSINFHSCAPRLISHCSTLCPLSFFDTDWCHLPSLALPPLVLMFVLNHRRRFASNSSLCCISWATQEVFEWTAVLWIEFLLLFVRFYRVLLVVVLCLTRSRDGNRRQHGDREACLPVFMNFHPIYASVLKQGQGYFYGKRKHTSHPVCFQLVLWSHWLLRLCFCRNCRWWLFCRLFGGCRANWLEFYWNL